METSRWICKHSKWTSVQFDANLRLGKLYTCVSRDQIPTWHHVLQPHQMLSFLTGARKTKEPLATSDTVKDDTSGTLEALSLVVLFYLFGSRALPAGGPDSPGAVKQPRP